MTVTPESLQGAYDNAKARGSELALLAKTAPPQLKDQLQLASKTYHAVSTILFSSLSLGQIEDLETVVSNASKTLPSTLFESKEWAHILESAMQMRQQEYAKKMKGTNKAEVDKLHGSLAAMSNDVNIQLLNMSGTIAMFKKQLVPMLRKETKKFVELQEKMKENDANYERIIGDTTSLFRKQLAEKDAEISQAKQEKEELDVATKEAMFQMRSSYEMKLSELKKEYENMQASHVKRHSLANSERAGFDMRIRSLERDMQEVADRWAKATKGRTPDETEATLDEYAHMEIEIQKLRSDITIKDKDLAAKNFQVELLSPRQRDESERQQMIDQIASLQSQIAQLETTINAKDADSAFTMTQLQDMQRQFMDLEKSSSERKDELEASLRNTEADLVAAMKQIVELSESSAVLSARATESEQAILKEKLAEELKNAELKKKLKDIQGELTAKDEAVKELVLSAQAQTEESGELATVREELTDAMKHIDDLKDVVKSSDTHISDLREALKKKDDEVAEHDANIKSKFETLEKMISRKNSMIVMLEEPKPLEDTDSTSGVGGHVIVVDDSSQMSHGAASVDPELMQKLADLESALLQKEAMISRMDEQLKDTNVAEALKQAEENLASALKQIQDLSDSTTALASKISELQQSLRMKEEALLNSSSMSVDLVAMLKAKEAEFVETSTSLHGAKTDLIEAIKEIHGLKETSNVSAARIAELERKLSHCEQCKASLREKEEEIASLLQQIGELDDVVKRKDREHLEHHENIKSKFSDLEETIKRKNSIIAKIENVSPRSEATPQKDDDNTSAAKVVVVEDIKEVTVVDEELLMKLGNLESALTQKELMISNLDSELSQEKEHEALLKEQLDSVGVSKDALVVQLSELEARNAGLLMKVSSLADEVARRDAEDAIKAQAVMDPIYEEMSRKLNDDMEEAKKLLLEAEDDSVAPPSEIDADINADKLIEYESTIADLSSQIVELQTLLFEAEAKFHLESARLKAAEEIMATKAQEIVSQKNDELAAMARASVASVTSSGSLTVAEPSEATGDSQVDLMQYYAESSDAQNAEIETLKKEILEREISLQKLMSEVEDFKQQINEKDSIIDRITSEMNELKEQISESQSSAAKLSTENETLKLQMSDTLRNQKRSQEETTEELQVILAELSAIEDVLATKSARPIPFAADLLPTSAEVYSETSDLPLHRRLSIFIDSQFNVATDAIEKLRNASSEATDLVVEMEAKKAVDDIKGDAMNSIILDVAQNEHNAALRKQLDCLQLQLEAANKILSERVSSDAGDVPLPQRLEEFMALHGSTESKSVGSAHADVSAESSVATAEHGDSTGAVPVTYAADMAEEMQSRRCSVVAIVAQNAGDKRAENEALAAQIALLQAEIKECEAIVGSAVPVDDGSSVSLPKQLIDFMALRDAEAADAAAGAVKDASMMSQEAMVAVVADLESANATIKDQQIKIDFQEGKIAESLSIIEGLAGTAKENATVIASLHDQSNQRTREVEEHAAKLADMMASLSAKDSMNEELSSNAKMTELKLEERIIEIRSLHDQLQSAEKGIEALKSQLAARRKSSIKTSAAPSEPSSESAKATATANEVMSMLMEAESRYILEVAKSSALENVLVSSHKAARLELEEQIADLKKTIASKENDSKKESNQLRSEVAELRKSLQEKERLSIQHSQIEHTLAQDPAALKVVSQAASRRQSTVMDEKVVALVSDLQKAQDELTHFKVAAAGEAAKASAYAQEVQVLKERNAKLKSSFEIVSAASGESIKEINGLRDEVAVANAASASLTDVNTQLAEELERVRDEYSKLKESSSGEVFDQAVLQTTIEKLHADVAAKENEVAVLLEDITRLEKTIADAAETTEKREQEMAKVKELLSQLESESAEQLFELQRLRKANDPLKARSSVKDPEPGSAGDTEIIEEQTSVAAPVPAPAPALAPAPEAAATSNAEVESLRAENAAHVAELDQLILNVKGLQTEIERLQSELAESAGKEEIEKLYAQIAQRDAQIEDLKKKIDDLMVTYDKIMTKSISDEKFMEILMTHTKASESVPVPGTVMDMQDSVSVYSHNTMPASNEMMIELMRQIESDRTFAEVQGNRILGLKVEVTSKEEEIVALQGRINELVEQARQHEAKMLELQDSLSHRDGLGYIPAMNPSHKYGRPAPSGMQISGTAQALEPSQGLGQDSTYSALSEQSDYRSFVSGVTSHKPKERLHMTAGSVPQYSSVTAGSAPYFTRDSLPPKVILSSTMPASTEYKLTASDYMPKVRRLDNPWRPDLAVTNKRFSMGGAPPTDLASDSKASLPESAAGSPRFRTSPWKEPPEILQQRTSHASPRSLSRSSSPDPQMRDTSRSKDLAAALERAKAAAAGNTAPSLVSAPSVEEPNVSSELESTSPKIYEKPTHIVYNEGPSSMSASVPAPETAPESEPVLTLASSTDLSTSESALQQPFGGPVKTIETRIAEANSIYDMQARAMSRGGHGHMYSNRAKEVEDLVQLATMKYQSKIANLEASCENYRQSVNQLEDSVSSYKIHITKLENDLLNFERLKGESFEDLRTHMDRNQAALLVEERKNAELKAEIFDLQATFTANEKRVVVAEKKAEETRRALMNTEDDLWNIKSKLSITETKLFTAETRLQKMTTDADWKVGDLMARLTEAEERIDGLRDDKRAAEGTISDMNKRLMATAHSQSGVNFAQLQRDPAVYHGMRKFQAMVRGMLARERMRELFVSRLAVQSGTLIAKRDTKQGESGWYTGPDGSVYYLTLENENWTLTAGPITGEQYTEMIKTTKLKNTAATSAMLTPLALPAAEGGPIPKDAMMFIENKSKKLYYAKPVV